MAEDATARVTRLGDEGDGLLESPAAGTSGLPAVVPGAVPGDRVRRLPDGALAIEPTSQSQRRLEPLCPHFPACGGCTAQHMADDLYAGWKAGRLTAALRRQGLEPDEAALRPMVRVPLGTRRRAVLTARGGGGDMRLGFHERQSHALVDIVNCAVLTPAIVAALGPLADIARVLGTGSDGCRLTVLDVGRGLDVAVETGRRKQRPPESNRLAPPAVAGRILRLTVDREPVVVRARPELAVSGVPVVPPPGAFVQACAEAESAMAAIAHEAIVDARAKRVADLFSGLGTFTFALARVARVLAVDGDKALLGALADAARHASGLKPIETKVRDLFADPVSPLELKGFDAVVLDPPRAGAKAQAEALARSGVRTVVAVSCNPATLARDLAALLGAGYRLRSLTPVDQFLYSPHLEAVAVLQR
jgi:23S rRNA (uracil1939-C5)-methyltransferase